MCEQCHLREPTPQTFSFEEALWITKHSIELRLCYQCQNFFKGILQSKLKEQGVGQADFTSVRSPND